MSEILDLLAQVHAALSEVALIDRASLDDTALLEVLKADEAVGRLVDASRVMDAGEVAERSRHELGASGLSTRMGERKPINFVEQITRVSQSEATRRIRIGSAIRARQSLLGEPLPPERPVLAEAVINGLVGVDSASVILHSLKQASQGSDATPERLDDAELALVELASSASADLVADAGRLWRDALDPDGIEPRFEDIRERRMITIGRQRNGITTYTIKADPPTAALLDAVFLDSMDPKVGPRFLSEEDQARTITLVADENGELVETIVDPRSIEQKRVDVLHGVLTAGVRATREGPTNLRTVGTVTAVISLNDLKNATGFGILEGSAEVIPASVIQELVCESGFYPVVVGNRGQPLYHGVRERYFTATQRRAIIARDGDRCISPGCRSRAAGCHTHHVIFHEYGGPTDVDNGVMLCPAHHHALHQGAFDLRMVDGVPEFRSSVDRGDESAWRPAGRSRLMSAA